MIRIIASLLIVVSLINPPEEKNVSIPSPKVTSEVAFCNFEVPKPVMIGNASFNVRYSFETDGKGEPIKIIKIHDNYVGEEQVTSCLKQWKFHGVKEGSSFFVSFRWEHGEGWVELSITGNQFRQSIKLTGPPCPYLRMQIEDCNKLRLDKRR